MDIDAMVENYWARKWEEMNAPDAWEALEPDWTDVADIVDGFGKHRIADLVRDILDGDFDLMTEALTNAHIDTDDVDGLFDSHWEDDDFMEDLYDGLREQICENLREQADRDGYHEIREIFNRRHEE